jgi:hypothetical protein
LKIQRKWREVAVAGMASLTCMFNGEFHPTSTCLARKKRQIIVAVLHPLSTGVNFINILRAAFMLAGPKNTKQHCWLDCLFLALLGSAGAKASQRTLMKLTPGVNFINILLSTLLRADPKRAKRQSRVRVNFTNLLV